MKSVYFRTVTHERSPDAAHIWDSGSDVLEERAKRRDPRRVVKPGSRKGHDGALRASGNLSVTQEGNSGEKPVPIEIDKTGGP